MGNTGFIFSEKVLNIKIGEMIAKYAGLGNLSYLKDDERIPVMRARLSVAYDESGKHIAGTDPGMGQLRKWNNLLADARKLLRDIKTKSLCRSLLS